MLGDFICRVLILVLGYAYPAFECFKVVEKNRVEIEQLRFWCQYWILLAMLTVIERFTDVFVSWLPMYGEMKLAFIIYLWYPKTQGTGYVYQTMLRPYVAKHETDIDRKIMELRARMWDLAIYYWRNWAELSQEKFFEILKFLAGQSARLSSAKPENRSYSQQPSAPPPPPNGLNSPRTPRPDKSKQGGSFGSQPSSTTVNRAVSEPTKSKLAEVNTRVASELSSSHNGYLPDSPTTPAAPSDVLQARLRLRRQNPHD